MDPHTFFVCANEMEFNRARHSAINAGIMKATAAFVIVVCRGTKEEVYAKGMPQDIASYEGAVPPEVIQALPSEFIRKNVERLSRLYGLYSGGALMFSYSSRYYRSTKKAEKTEDVAPVEAVESTEEAKV